MRRGVVIKTVINGMTFNGATKDPVQKAVRDALIAFMAATAQAQAEATKAAQRAGIEHAKQTDERAYLGRKPSFTRAQFTAVRQQLGQNTVLTQIAKDAGLSRQTVYRIKDDPAACEALACGLGVMTSSFASWRPSLGNSIIRIAMRCSAASCRSIIALTSGSISTIEISLSAVHCQNWKARRTGIGVRIDSKRSGVTDFGPDLVLFVNNHRSFTQLVAVSACTSFSSEPLIWRFPSVGTN